MDNQATVPADLAGSAIAQAHEFFVTQVTEWAEVSGDPAKVEARLHALTRALRDHLKLVVIDLEAGDNAQVIRVIANTTNAIGYVSLGEVIKAAEAGQPVRLVKLNGIEPVMENVTNKTYPLFHPLYLISKGEPQGGSRVLLDFLRSPEGKAIIRQGNYVPLE